MSSKLPLIALLLLHAVLAIWYATITPYRTGGAYYGSYIPDIGAPDERQHVNYVQGLLDGKGIPVFNPKDPNLGETYQSHQPPLYYLLAAGFAKLTGTTDLTGQSGRTLRYLNALIGAGSVAGVFYLGFWGTGRRRVGFAAATIAALLPMNLALSGAVSSDPLLFMLCTWSLALTARCLCDGWNLKRGLALAACMGLAFVTKTNAVALLPAIGFAWLVTRPTTTTWKQLAGTFVVAVLIALPWWFRNQQLYGDPLAIKAFGDAFQGSPTQTSLGLDSGTYWIDWVSWFTARSFIGVFGYMEIFLSDSFYRVALTVLLILAVGGLLALRKQEWNACKSLHLLNAFFVLVVVLLFVRFNLQYFQGQARYILPAIGPISILMGLGVLYYSREKWKESVAVLAAMMVVLNLYVLTFLPPQFEQRIKLGAEFQAQGR